MPGMTAQTPRVPPPTAPLPRQPPTRAPAADLAGPVGRPLGSGAVRLTSGLLAHWQQRNREVTVPHTTREIERAGNLENLRRIADDTGSAYAGRYPFLDTDVYKTLEGLAYVIAQAERDAGDDVPPETVEARRFYEAAVDLVARSQCDDGYVGSAFLGAGALREPWSDLAWGHEMYNLGHLTQAAVAAARQLGDTRLLDVARRFADLVVRRYGEGGEPAYCGHPEVEMALVELYRETGETAYLRQAGLFVDRRGSGTLAHTIFPPDYFQDHVPLRELPSVTGHAVRMVYLAAGATDVALETGDTELLGHLGVLWDDMVATKSYLTGGLGARHSDEAFGDRYELPSERAYAETCAAIGAMQWGWRLFVATGRADVLDTVERILYNAYAVGLSLAGDAFFYDNPLQRRPDHEQRSGAESGGEPLRRAWFGCPCCPPNVVRWMAQLQDHVAVADDASLTLGLITAGVVESPALDVEVRTGYPFDGEVEITVLRATDGPATLTVRVPGWARGARIEVAGGPPTTAPPGWARLERHWRAGDRVRLTLPMRVRVVGSHPYLDATRGAAAVLRGPVVHCVEQHDAPAPVDDLVLVGAREATAPSAEDPVLRHAVEGLVTVRVPVGRDPYPDLDLDHELDLEVEPGAPATAAQPDVVPVPLVPYFLWGNRGPAAMRVWLRRS